MSEVQRSLTVPELEQAFMNDDHHEAARLLEAVGRAREEGDDNAVREAFAAFVEFNREHFAREDELMERVGFPQKDYHRQEHAAHLARWEALLAGLEDGSMLGADLVSALDDEIIPWYQRHFTTMDALLARFAERAAGG
ncbi:MULTISPECIES: bacteriohemerythrin [unclassified Thioalkalivibrio]|uniref:bacteriohemerythrin n=1 Tax=unclassified Thioalkalivibrio TaxID=2621013 RepID=UPI000374D066|nr:MULTISPECIES: hemerythrin family protein [unclassified Thioalkalivibrio]PYG00736.1 hemerythrin [Thioalkalivibrio sp. ALE21]